MDSAQPPSMIEKQVKKSKAKSEKKEMAESPAIETGPIPDKSATSLEGK